jgi:hypothetical protein
MTTAEVLSEDMDTTIRISIETRDELVDLGKKNESYDTILKRLIQFWQDNQEAVRQWQEGKEIEYLNSMRYAPAMSADVLRKDVVVEPKRKERKS